MRSEPFDFDNGRGHRLSGRLERPDGEAHAFALFAHCFSCSKSSLAATRISRALAAKGVGTLRFDFTGLGESEGQFGEGLGCDIDDLVAAAEHMAGRGCAPALLIGHSLGGAAVLAAASRIPSAKAVTVIGAPFDAAHVIRQLAPDVARLTGEGEAEVLLGGRPFRVGKGLVEELRSHDQGARIMQLGRPLLILHSPIDAVVGIENASEIFLAARHPKSFVSLDHADHLITRAEDAEYAAEVITAWASRYVGAQADAPLRRTDGAVLVEETGAGRFQMQVTASGERFISDEPVEVGGLGSGPTPYELLAAGLGACTAMTARLYAAQKSWPLRKVSVAVRHSKRPGQTPADLFEREVEIDGPLDDAQRARLLEIANKCPVHRTLEAGSAVATKLAEAARLLAEHCDGEAHFQEMEEACKDTG
jgi:putative redox protein